MKDHCQRNLLFLTESEKEQVLILNNYLLQNINNHLKNALRRQAFEFEERSTSDNKIAVKMFLITVVLPVS